MSIYRNAVWVCKGLKEYTKGGFESASKSFDAADLSVDCTGKSYMITGANSGIGKQVWNDSYFQILDISWICSYVVRDLSWIDSKIQGNIK